MVIAILVTAAVAIIGLVVRGLKRANKDLSKDHPGDLYRTMDSWDENSYS